MAGDPNLIEQYKTVHNSMSYGRSSLKSLRVILPEVVALNPGSVIDYGCGRSRLIDNLGLPESCQRYRYDPGVEAYAVKPEVVADLLINVDVLEHVEEADVDGVLADMRGLCRNALIIIDLAPAKLILPDGRNAHVCLKEAEWWKARLESHFGTVYPARTIRRTRVAFRTWKRDPAMQWIYLRTLVGAYTRHYVGRLLGRREKL